MLTQHPWVSACPIHSLPTLPCHGQDQGRQEARAPPSGAAQRWHSSDIPFQSPPHPVLTWEAGLGSGLSCFPGSCSMELQLLQGSIKGSGISCLEYHETLRKTWTSVAIGREGPAPNTGKPILPETVSNKYSCAVSSGLEQVAGVWWWCRIEVLKGRGPRIPPEDVAGRTGQQAGVDQGEEALMWVWKPSL